MSRYFCGIEDAYVLVVKEGLERFNSEEIRKVGELFGISSIKINVVNGRVLDINCRYDRLESYGDDKIMSNAPDYYYLHYEDLLEQCSQSEHQEEEEEVWWLV